MKTAKEVFEKVNGFSLIGDNETICLTKRNIFKAMEEYVEQFKYDFSQACRCKDSPGSTWCCNLCGLPIDNDSPSKEIYKSDAR